MKKAWVVSSLGFLVFQLPSPALLAGTLGSGIPDSLSPAPIREGAGGVRSAQFVPRPGFWKADADEFYVSGDSGSVQNFASYVSVPGCGEYKITHMSSVPISGNFFSFTGSYYASGTFTSDNAASGTVGFLNYTIAGCGQLNGGPWNWSAAFQPAPTPVEPGKPWINDYNGDGTSDIAVFRGSAGLWSVRNVTRAYFGASTDGLVPGDYNGNGTTDIAIFRPAAGLWSVKDLTRFYLGSAGDAPVPGDYNGDGRTEGGVFRGASGLWSIRDLTRVFLGSSGDTVIPGYYDGDSARDIAVFRGSSGTWSVRNLTRFCFGASTDELVPGDYNGAGRWEAGIFRPAAGLWSIRNVTRFYLGSAGDWALPADYNGDGVDEAAVFRSPSGMWSVRNLTRVFFGATGDVPATR